MAVQDEIRQKIEAGFAPRELTVIDESDRHIGHAGYREGGESHFRVMVRSAAFRDMTRLERHRAVHAALGAELVGRIHALALDLDA